MAPVCLEESILRQNGNGAFAIAETTDREFLVDFLFYFLKFPLDFPSIRAVTKLKLTALYSLPLTRCTYAYQPKNQSGTA